MKHLDSIVEIAGRFHRSVNISNQLHSDDELDIEGYQLLASCVQVLDNLANHLTETHQRAFTITGAYGSGKSSLGYFLCSLAGLNSRKKTIASGKLSVFPGGQHIIDVLGTPQRTIIALNGRKGSLAEDLNRVLFPDSPDRGLLENLKQNPQRLKQPTILVIDELGRYVSGDQMENCAVLQDFAEALNTPGNEVVFIGILHQNFSSYADTRTQKDEWSKVQGRFMDLPLVSYQEETLKILSSAVVQSTIPEESARVVDASIEKVLSFFKDKGRISEEAYRNSFRESWPINPVVCLLLGPISRRSFWQNNRSIYNFLTSKEPYGFQDFLEKTAESSTELYSPHNLWDYLYSNYQHLIASDMSEGHRWINAEDCISRTQIKGSEDHVRLVKTIALISIFKAGSGIDAHKLILEASMPGYSDRKIDTLLDDLINWKIVVPRREQGTYLLFDNGSFDVNREKEKYSEMQIDSSLLNNYVTLPPIIARKHYAETGNLRLFNVELTAKGQLKSLLPTLNKSDMGKIFLLLDSFDSEADQQIYIQSLRDQLEKAGHPPVLFGFPENSKRISDISREILILKKIQSDPVLEGDRTARLEVENQLESLTALLREEINRVYLSIDWLMPDSSLHSTKDYRELNSLISDFCDKEFPLAPTLANELINRQKISGNIRAAQKKLILAMVANESEERLGITGTPPEMMIYLTLFAQNSLHVKGDDGKYAFVMPKLAKGNTKQFKEIWKKTRGILEKKKIVDLMELYEIWDKPPFGIKNGVKPLLLVYFFLTNKECLSFYQDGIYEPILTNEILELLLAAPKHMKVRYHRIEKKNTELCETLFGVLQNYDSSLTGRAPLSIARSLVKIVLTQPKWVQITSRASAETKRFRETVVKAHDPLELIFTDLPMVFNTFDSKEIVSGTIRVLNELMRLNPELLQEVRESLYKAIDSGSDLEELRSRAKRIADLTSQLQLKRFINNIAEYTGSDQDVEKILGLASGKMVGKWTDLDIVNAKLKISELAFSFRHLEGIANLNDGDKGNRRLFGLVLAGSEGRDDMIVDIPAKLPENAQTATDKIVSILNELPPDLAIAALIESGLKMEKKNG